MNDKERVIERLKGNKLKKSKFMGKDAEWVSDDGGDLDQIFDNENNHFDEVLDDDSKW